MAHQFRQMNVAAALLGLSLSLAGHSAYAASDIKVSASINASLTIIDLTPDDGKAAGYTVVDTMYSALDANIHARAASWRQDQSARSVNNEPIAATVNYGTSSSVSSAPKWGEMRTELQLNDSVGNTGTAGGNAQHKTFLRIDPHTQLIYSGYGELSISDAGQAGFLGEAVATVRFNEEYWVRGMMQGSAGYTDSGVRGGNFSFSAYNDSDTTQYVSVLVDILSRAAYYTPSPVPEPSTYAMFGLGALMLGAMSRRKRRQAPAA